MRRYKVFFECGLALAVAGQAAVGVLDPRYAAGFGAALLLGMAFDYVAGRHDAP